MTQLTVAKAGVGSLSLLRAMRGIIVLICSGLAFADPGLAQSTANKLLACRTIVNDSLRLACFDRESSALAELSIDGKSAVLEYPSEVRAKEDAARRASFGLSAQETEAAVAAATRPISTDATAAPPTPDSPTVRSVNAKIVEAVATISGTYILVLDEGGIWRTTEAQRRFTPKSGDSIEIERASLGSYMARLNGGRPVRITRMK